jgi:hypothetical protein
MLCPCRFVGARAADQPPQGALFPEPGASAPGGRANRGERGGRRGRLGRRQQVGRPEPPWAEPHGSKQNPAPRAGSRAVDGGAASLRRGAGCARQRGRGSRKGSSEGVLGRALGRALGSRPRKGRSEAASLADRGASPHGAARGRRREAGEHGAQEPEAEASG